MTIGKGTDTALAKQLVAGTKKHFSSVGSLMFANGTSTPAQVETELQALVDMRAAVDDAKAATKAKLAIETADAGPLRNRMMAYVAREGDFR